MNMNEIRHSKGISLKELSDATDISMKTLLSYEEDKEKLENALTSNVIKIANQFDVTVERFFEIESYKNNIRQMLCEWEQYEKRETFDEINTRYFNKLYRWHKREQITDEDYEKVVCSLKAKKEAYLKMVSKRGFLKKEVEKKYIRELNELMVAYSPIISKRDSDSSIVRFKKMRYLKDASLEKLAFCTGKNKQTFKNYEAEHRNIDSVSAKFAIEVCLILECKVNDIFLYDKGK